MVLLTRFCHVNQRTLRAGMPLQIDPSLYADLKVFLRSSVPEIVENNVHTNASLPRWPAESFASAADLANPQFHLHIADKHEKLRQV